MLSQRECARLQGFPVPWTVGWGAWLQPRQFQIWGGLGLICGIAVVKIAMTHAWYVCREDTIMIRIPER